MAFAYWILAQGGLDRLAESTRDLKTLSAQFIQTRKSALLAEPLKSEGRLYYRREPARMVFVMKDAEIHLDRSTYQVLRRAEQRLERVEFKGGELAPTLFLMFSADLAGIQRRFKVGGSGDEIRLTPLDASFGGLSLVLEKNQLRRFTFTDAEGDEVEFELNDVARNPELPAARFELAIPEGTRILKHEKK